MDDDDIYYYQYFLTNTLGLLDRSTKINPGDKDLIRMVKRVLRGHSPDVYDAALVSARSEGQIFRRVALPLVARGVAVTALFGLVLIWNEFLVSSVFTGPHTSTVAVGIWTGLGTGNTAQVFIALETAATLAYLPALAVMLAIR